MSDQSFLKLEKQSIEVVKGFVNPRGKYPENYPTCSTDDRGLYFVDAGYAEIHSGFFSIFMLNNERCTLRFNAEYHGNDSHPYSSFFYGKDSVVAEVGKSNIVKMRDEIILAIDNKLKSEFGDDCSLKLILGNDGMDKLYKYYSFIVHLDNKLG
ncbi:MAG: hypothetical protein H7A00_03700 [Hahellaceae bacterium]|nr:hypothetical protein [Hahellaceae bacterium]